MKRKVKVVRVLAEAVGLIIEAIKKISNAVRLFVEAVRVLAESLWGGKYRPWECVEEAIGVLEEAMRMAIDAARPWECF
jgi:hypothetical protein